MKFEKLAEIKAQYGADGEEQQKEAEMNSVKDEMEVMKAERIKEAQERRANK